LHLDRYRTGWYCAETPDGQLSHRFCRETTNTTIQPPASATETGTLFCPFPPPPLAIAPVVLLSWPGEDDGWIVESATTVDGPWVVSDATPFMQYGCHSITVPTDGERRFFRQYFRLHHPSPRDVYCIVVRTTKKRGHDADDSWIFSFGKPPSP
jgi:hypothetical protein